MNTPKPANDNPDYIDIGFAKLETIMEHCNAVSTYLADLAEIVTGERPDQSRFAHAHNEQASRTIALYLIRLGSNHLSLSLGLKELFDSLQAGIVPPHLPAADLSRLPALYPPGFDRNLLDSEPPLGTPEHLEWQERLARAFAGTGGPH